MASRRLGISLGTIKRVTSPSRESQSFAVQRLIAAKDKQVNCAISNQSFRSSISSRVFGFYSRKLRKTREGIIRVLLPQRALSHAFMNLSLSRLLTQTTILLSITSTVQFLCAFTRPPLT